MMRVARIATMSLAVGLLVVGLPACSDDDGADARASGGQVSIVGPAPPGGGGSVSAVGSGCTTKGATTKRVAHNIEVALDEWSLQPPASTPAGVNRIVAKNFGSQPHQLVLARAASPEALPVADGRVDEEALDEATTFRIEAFPRNTICEGTFELAAGSYVLFCNLPAPGADGPNHFGNGMVATLTVS